MSGFLDFVESNDASMLNELGDPANLDGVAVMGIYEAEFTGPTFGGVPTDIVEPSYYMQAAKVGSSGQGSCLVVEGLTFKVVRVKPDGTRMVYLILRGAT